MTGTLKRVGTTAFTITVPVNGVPRVLRALHVTASPMTAMARTSTT